MHLSTIMKVTLMSISMLTAAVLYGCAGLSGLDLALPWQKQATARPTDASRAYAHFLAGVMYERRGKIDRAVAQYEQLLSYDAGAITPSVRLVRALRRQGNAEKSLKIARDIVSRHPDNPELWILLGEGLYQSGRHEEALDAFKRAVEINPAELTSYAPLLEAQESMNDYVAAADVYEKLAARHPDQPAFQFQYALSLFRIGDYTAAASAFEKVLELQPAFSRARYLMAVSLMESGRVSESIPHFVRYLESQALDTQALGVAAAAFFRQGAMAEAFNLFQIRLALQEAEPEDFFRAALVALVAGMPGEAIKITDAVSSPVLGGLIRILAARALDSQADLDPALLDSPAGSLNEECETFLLPALTLLGPREMGDRLINAMDPLRTELEGRKALSQVIAFTRARIYMVQEAYPLAVEAFQEALSAPGGQEDPWVHSNLAYCYQELRQWEPAERHYRRAIELLPDNPDMLNNLGYFLADRNIRLDEAETLLKRVLNTDPDNPFYLDSLGWVYYRKGRLQQALDFVRRAVYGMNHDDAELREHLGDIYAAMGNMTKAVEEWSRALRLDRKRESVRQKLEQHRPAANGT